MKYIKQYKIFESSKNNEFMQQISDILLDLNDDGFGVVTDSHGRNDKDFIDISRVTVEVNDGKDDDVLYVGRNYFNYSKIEDCIGHLLLFMKDNGYILDKVSYGDDYDKYDNLKTDDIVSTKKSGISDEMNVLKNLEIANFIKLYFITKVAHEERINNYRKRLR